MLEMAHKMTLFGELVRRRGESEDAPDDYENIMSIMKETLTGKDHKDDLHAIELLYMLMGELRPDNGVSFKQHMKDVLGVVDRIIAWFAVFEIIASNEVGKDLEETVDE